MYGMASWWGGGLNIYRSGLGSWVTHWYW